MRRASGPLQVVHRSVLMVSIVLLSWLGMMIVHESGHVAIAWITGGKVNKVILNPFEFSRTDVFPDPHPLAVAWGGPIIGVLLPLTAFSVAAMLRWSGTYLLRFFAGFCLVANGAYIGAGSFNRIGDTYPMLLFGSSLWQLWLFGALTVSLGLFLWHHLGPHFGLGPHAKRVNPAAAYGTLGLLLLVMAAEFLLPAQPKSPPLESAPRLH